MNNHQKWQKVMDTLAPLVTVRWAFAFALLLLYALRVFLAKGFYIITYGLGIFLLNLFISFLSPQTDPDLEEDADQVLPTRSDDEFRPFVRKLPEFKFWYSTCKALLVAMLLTTSRAFDVPVFWPILLFYFILLFVLTMKKRIQHMIRHKYVPVTRAKPKVVARVPEGKEFERKMFAGIPD
eukprot:NODE_5744_length_616_cov_18.400818_g5580_i0.p1 GENE.NODE_5744_length_616_cov_18.400818_g5580_i0~~NODE_5744_length_616_cov_18.400818_g5580_i0.p1  ORF type:complete len:195 (+),score=59.67 NODE_5744_length_616_cov_18.400818_g5580_i0:43-585(+)